MSTSIQPTHLPISPHSSSSKPNLKAHFPITHLPSDILITLLRLIPCPQILSAFSLCSKQFHHYTTPYLYSHFQHHGETCTSLSHFLHTILHKPHLALYTKTFTANALLGYCTDIDMSLFTTRDWDILARRLKEVHISENGERDPYFNPHISSQWYSFIRQGNWDAIVAFLLCLLPNIHTLNIVNHASGCPYGYPYLETVLHRAANLQHQRLLSPHCPPQPYSFPYLQNLHLAKHDLIHYPRMGFEILRLLPFLAIPSVRKVETHMISDYHFPFSILPSASPSQSQSQQPPHQTSFTLSTFYSFPLPNFAFTTTHLTLSHTVLRSSSLSTFFSYFRTLKCLSWKWNFSPQNANREGLVYNFNITHFLNSINHLRDILEVLKVRICPESINEEESEGEDRGIEEDEWISILSSFTTLKELELDIPPYIPLFYKSNTKTPITLTQSQWKTSLSPASVSRRGIEGISEQQRGRIRESEEETET
ncbi:hypothetical protein EAF04_007427 [Stromatinia cepivora]|nr:hypothetical protein EAF04_007427 [Stromatinia cepivora]